jgi:Lactonase, 7-bladed beta-propeller
MRIAVRSWFSRFAPVIFAVCIASGSSAGADQPHYVVTNDDVPPRNESSVTFYTVGTDGLLTLKKKVPTGGIGVAGGFFSAKRVNVLDSGDAQCVYASQATSDDVVGIVLKTLKLGGTARGSSKDDGRTNGIGLALNANYLYANFIDSNTIATFKVKPGCKISFVGDTAVKGLQGGLIDGMALHGDILVVTYGDGSIESFDISGGKPVSNGDEQNSTGSRENHDTYPTAVDITQDGHYALFGDTSTSTVVEVSDISSGKLTPTLVYHLGKGISSSNILLSPDETMLYISNNQGATASAAFFDKTTGQLSEGCISGKLKGYVEHWIYLGGLALQNATGPGGMVYVAEYGNPSYIAELTLKSDAGKCTLTESPESPVEDPNSPGLLSIGSFPPRPF